MNGEVLLMVGAILAGFLVNLTVLAYGYGKLSQTAKHNGNWLERIDKKLDRHIEAHASGGDSD